MPFRDFLPFTAAARKKPTAKKAQILDVDDRQTLAKLFKVAGLALGFQGGSGSRANFEESPYDFDRIIKAVDTDSYVKQAFNKYKELLWKEGWDIVGENPEAVSYLLQRVDFMELSMGRPFQDLLNDIGDQLAKFANAFVVKSRGDLGPFFPTPLQGIDGGDPIVGYYIVPAETMQIARDKNNKIKKYRQDVGGGAGGGKRPPEWKPEDVIHFCIDRKPGRVFGTPFMIATVDDVVALRQIEEDIQNLVHRELFPLYKYKVGTEDNPAEPGEIEAAAEELANLRTEGGLVLPDRHDVEVVGADGNALQADPYLAHFKERVCVGLGLAPHHLGMMMNGGNRSVTDRLDVALYDKIKTYQRYISAMIQLHMFNELLLEGGFDPYVHPAQADVSDRCIFEFNEIDVDTQVKRETHEIQKYTANAMQLDELRLKLGVPPEADEQQLLAAIQARLTPTTDTGQPKISTKPGATYPGGGVPGGGTASPSGSQPLKPDAAKSSTGGRINPSNKAQKAIGNKVRPSNQFGRRKSPNIRRMERPVLPASEWLEEVTDLLDEGT